MRLISLRLAALTAIAGITFGCQAEPPEAGPGTSLPPAGAARFANVSTCVPPKAGQNPPACPGDNCAQNAIGNAEPDGRAVDLAICTLDLVFTKGTIVTPEGGGGRPDLLIHLGAKANGPARVEASENGTDYQVIGFLNRAAVPGSVNARCIARCVERRCQSGETCLNGQPCDLDGFCYADTCSPGGSAVLDLSAGLNSAGCNSVYNVRHLRLSHFQGSPTSVSIDAAEALEGSFCLANDPNCKAGQ